jgi:hypothetical protein
MPTEKEMKQAVNAYKNLCKMLDNRGWKYEKHNDEHSITCSATGDDLPIDITIDIHEENSLIIFKSKVATMPEEKLVEGALAVNVINTSIINGVFEIDLSTGTIYFRLVNSFRDSLISQEVYNYVLGCSCVTVDKFNDKLVALADGKLTLGELYNYAQTCWND